VTWKLVVDDENTPRFYEPLLPGPYKGRTTDRELVERMRSAYFETLGWDERGVPTEENLERLGLIELEHAMKRIRK